MPPSNLNRHSTAQTCFFKILHIISVFPAGDTDRNQCSNIHDQNSQNKDLNFDLNVSLRHPTEIEPVQPLATAENGGDEECNNKRRDEGCLGLLIDAAQLILGEHESKPPVGNDVESPAKTAAAEIEHGTKRKEESWKTEWLKEFDCTLPALKSKRGRNLVLPEKYRDSFVEPLIRSVQRSKRRTKW